MSQQMKQGDRPDRRDWMAAAAATVALVNDIAHAGDQPGKQVEDRASAIRITGLKATTFGGFLYVKVETNRGIAGWGETAGLEPQSAAALVHSFSQLLVGENPTRIEYLWQMLYRAHRDIRGGPFMVHTISAIDQALWDIAGKLHGVPVFRLLGGPVRDKIRWYNNKFAHKAPPYGIYEHAGSPPDFDNLVRAIADARKAVGPKGAVMFDAHCAVPPATLIQFAAVPLFLIHETNLNATPKGLVRAEWKDHNDGYVGLPSGPGLGVEVDEKELERLSKVPSEWKWPVYGRLKDGSIADY